MEQTQDKKEEVKTVQTFSEAKTDRYAYRILEKSWSKGNFISLERSELVETTTGDIGINKRAKNMFTLPKDVSILQSLMQGMQGVIDTVEGNGGSSKKKK